NVLVALYIDDHPLHARATSWFSSTKGRVSIATCPVTEGTLLRMHMTHAKDKSAAAAWSALENCRSLPGHEFWDDNFSYVDISPKFIQGHRQVTDAWLVELTRRRDGKLATLDAALATLHPDVVELIPVIL
ncbi:MAG: TA system VapC family ribonuclease toxin, partial [Roseibacillus sp.]